MDVEHAGRDRTLDPVDWEEFRRQAYGALDTMIDHLRGARERPVWQPVPESVATFLSTGLPEEGIGLERVLDEFREHVLPYPSGNTHPRFWSWVSGTGSPTGMVADLLASGMNALGLGFDDSAPSRVEMQVIEWFKEMFAFPVESSGLLVSGGSMANLVGLAVGRTAHAGYDVRREGVGAAGARRLVVYGSTETHSSVQKAAEVLGLGGAYVRSVPVDERYEIDLDSLEAMIQADRTAGLQPAILVGNAGTVNTGAIDPMDRLADIAAREDLWFHVDGAFGAIAVLADDPPPNLGGLGRVDSLAFDLHKWLHQPYNVGAVLVRHAQLHRDTFRIAPAYLDPPGGGVAAGPINFNALGVQLSRSFAALRPWLSFRAHGVEAFRHLTTRNIEQARYLDGLIRASDELEILAPTPLNVVNFRFNPGGLDGVALDHLNQRILVQLQERGIAAPSSTRLGGSGGPLSIRVCVTNHRSRFDDFDLLVENCVAIGRELLAGTRAGETSALR